MTAVLAMPGGIVKTVFIYLIGKFMLVFNWRICYNKFTLQVNFKRGDAL